MRTLFTSAVFLASVSNLLAEAHMGEGKWASCRMCSEDRFGPCGTLKFFQEHSDTIDGEENRNPIKAIASFRAIPPPTEAEYWYFGISMDDGNIFGGEADEFGKYREVNKQF